MKTYTVNLDSSKPIHISHKDEYPRVEGVDIRHLYYAKGDRDTTSLQEQGFPPGTAPGKGGTRVAYENLDEFTMAFLQVAYGLSQDDLTECITGLTAAYGEPPEYDTPLMQFLLKLTRTDLDDPDTSGGGPEGPINLDTTPIDVIEDPDHPTDEDTDRAIAVANLKELGLI
jgi:hypothetical protein